MNSKDATLLKLDWSAFARGRHKPGGSRPWFRGTEAELLDPVRLGWPRRRPGAGRTDLKEVVVVPVPADLFVGTTLKVTRGKMI